MVSYEILEVSRLLQMLQSERLAVVVFKEIGLGLFVCVCVCVCTYYVYECSPEIFSHSNKVEI